MVGSVGTPLMTSGRWSIKNNDAIADDSLLNREQNSNVAVKSGGCKEDTSTIAKLSGASSSNIAACRSFIVVFIAGILKTSPFKSFHNNKFAFFDYAVVIGMEMGVLGECIALIFMNKSISK